jgi:hypothetical protein
MRSAMLTSGTRPRSADLDTCRHATRMQIEHLKRPGLRAFRPPRGPGTYRP